MLPSSTQALILALRLRGTALPHDRTIAKSKKWMAQTKWQNGSYCYWYNNTYRREHFFRSGEEDKHIGCSQDKGGRIQSIAHSQPTRSAKEGVDYVSKLSDVNDDHYKSFHFE